MEIVARILEEDIDRIAQRVAHYQALMSGVKDMTFEEIAKTLRCSVPTVARKIKEKHLGKHVIQMGRNKGLSSEFLNELKK